jgi:hypothetical protein
LRSATEAHRSSPSSTGCAMLKGMKAFLDGLEKLRKELEAGA